MTVDGRGRPVAIGLMQAEHHKDSRRQCVGSETDAPRPASRQAGFLPSLARPPSAGPQQERDMSDDEKPRAQWIRDAEGTLRRTVSQVSIGQIGSTPPPTTILSAPLPASEEPTRAEMDRRDSEQAYREPYWPTPRVLAWIGYRSIEKINNSLGGLIYKTMYHIENEQPKYALLNFLKNNYLQAERVNDGEKIDSIFWKHKAERDLTSEPLMFDRDDVLRLWPEIGHVTAVVDEPGEEDGEVVGRAAEIGASMVPADSSADLAPAVRIRKLNPSPAFDKVVAVMMKMSREDVWNVLDKNLNNTFGASITVCKNAREHVYPRLKAIVK